MKREYLLFFVTKPGGRDETQILFSFFISDHNRDGHVLFIDPFLDDNPKVAIPMHYNTFPVIEADPNEFKKQVETIGQKAIVLEFGQEIEL